MLWRSAHRTIKTLPRLSAPTLYRHSYTFTRKMSDEAFPNSEQLFRSAFDQPNSPSELLKLIKEHPTYPAVVDLLVYYTCVAEENPTRAEALASILLQVRDAPDAPIINTDLTLMEVFSRKLADLHGRGLEVDDDTKTLGPSNTFLTGSLLSGLSFKYQLTSCSDQYGAILDALDVNPSSPTTEVLVTGACIQLLTAGSEIIQHSTSYFKSADEVATKLKAQKTAGAVKDANALKLLELANWHAETGFKKENDINNVWERLFPSQA
ncbi:hypothetical protein BDN70DRAFT_918142 [Pholiota conissans]|uniref:Uncharacterized protein n=1 Tax=Pholiota conissans TaxID=109636 RepID=A0A9P5ZD35_9AGAR|nr:hypothetical protein BDN70DRAFT_918142 [Pholiota conissans]